MKNTNFHIIQRTFKIKKKKNPETLQETNRKMGKIYKQTIDKKLSHGSQTYEKMFSIIIKTLTIYSIGEGKKKWTFYYIISAKVEWWNLTIVKGSLTIVKKTAYAFTL